MTDDRSLKRPDLVLVNAPLKDYGVRPKINQFTLPTLGLGYIATCAEAAGFSVELLDAEAMGLGVDKAAQILNELAPRWVGFNLLAPTYIYSAAIASKLDPNIKVMLGGHQAKAMPGAILNDPRFPRIDAMVLGEAETRVPLLLSDLQSRGLLPRVYWREGDRAVMPDTRSADPFLLAPDIDELPYLNRRFLPQDPYDDAGVIEAAMVGSRGCPFDCSFCGAAVSANPDVSIRMRSPANLLGEIASLQANLNVQRVRFVDDLFLANRKLMNVTLRAFISEDLGVRWDATGRINILANAPTETIDLMRRSGCREVALGIETGSDRLLRHIDKKITVDQTKQAVVRLCAAGINVKGYFILGLPTESREEHAATLALIHQLWDLTSSTPGKFRCSVFEYRPYPGTPDWHRLVDAGYSVPEMLDYEPNAARDDAPLDYAPDRDEFNFSTGLQFGEVPVSEVRRNLSGIMKLQQSLCVPTASSSVVPVLK